jgi:hypothetical protein
LITSRVGSAFENTLLKERQKGCEEEGEDVSSHWMTLRNKEILAHERGITR